MTDHSPLTGAVAGPPAPLRACHLASGDLWAGAEAHVTNLLAELAQVPHLDVHAVVLNEGLLAERLRDRAVSVTVLPETRYSAPRLVALLQRRLRELRVDLLHTHGYKQNILGTVAARLAGVRRLVRTEHGVPEPLVGWPGLRMRVYQRLNALAARRCDGIIAVSEDLAARWRSRFAGRSTAVTVVVNGVPVPAPVDPAVRAKVRARLEVPDDCVLFGALARMVPIKGLSTLIEAAALLHRREPRAVFVLAGDGPLRASLQSQTAALGLEKVVRFPGFTSVPTELLAALDAYVLPSLGEGVPMALLEALALGKPVVATAVGGVAELLTSEVTAILVRPGRPEELASACVRLIQDPGVAASLGARGRALVAERLSARRMAAEVHAFYRELAAPAVTVEVPA
jgi:glycosyltransferase involved in cell wall biosynthesis